MAISIEERGELQRSVKLSIATADIQSQVTNRLQEMSGKMKVNGFRPGHVPYGEAKRRFGTQIEQEVTNQAMQKAFLELVEERSIRLAGSPTFKPSTLILADGQYRFEAEFEVLPEFELADLSTMKIEQPSAKVTDDDVDENIQSFRRNRQTFEAVAGHAAELGDRLIVDWSSTAYDSKNKPHNDQREDSSLVLDETALPEPIVAGLKGAKAGDEVTIELPQAEAETGDEQPPRKPAVIECKVKLVEVPNLPELDEKFISDLGLDGVNDEASFRAHVKQSLGRRLRDSLWQRVKSQTLTKLAEIHADLKLPESLIQYEYARMKEAAASRMKGTKFTSEDEQRMRKSAQESARLQLIVEKIIKENNIKVAPDDVKERIEQLAEGHPEPQQVIDWYYSNDEQFQRIQNIVLEELVVRSVLDQAQVNTVQISYAEAVSAQAT